MGTLYAMGGNVRTAAVNHGVFSAFLSVLEIFCAGSVLPITGICLAFAMLDAIVGRGNLRGLAALIKRTYALSLSFLMGIFCFVLSTQSTLAGAGDTLALRTARFAAGNFLPLLGGSISETLRTVAGSVQYLRGVVGTGAILALFFLFLPLFISILLTRITLLLGSAVAGFLNCDAQGKLLTELAAVYGYFLAILAAVFVMVIFSLTLFTRCAAVG
jgi:stage III sporulation protein AE